MKTRRSMLSGGMAGLLLASGAFAQQSENAAPARIIPIWPAEAPGSAGVTVEARTIPRRPDSGPEDVVHYGVRRPTLGLVHPAKPNGRAILLIPGGGYERVASAASGGDLARFLAARGYLVGTLIYRLPYDGWKAGPGAPLQDAQRALRLLKQEAGPSRKVGVFGFSAGGHVAGMLATSFAEDSYAPLDAVDRISARPDFAGLFFAVTTMTDPNAHGPSRRNLLGKAPTPDMIARWSVEQRVNSAMPPCFVTHAADDRTVKVDNCLMLFAALRAQQVPAALHVFDIGGHGFGRPGDATGPGHFWPDLFDDWIQRQKLDQIS